MSRRSLEIELQCELNQPRVIARRDDAPEVAGVNNLSGGWTNAGGVEVADGVVEMLTMPVAWLVEAQFY